MPIRLYVNVVMRVMKNNMRLSNEKKIASLIGINWRTWKKEMMKADKMSKIIRDYDMSMGVR